MSLNRRMSDKHEADLAEWFGGRVMPGSGNQARNPMDVRQFRYSDFFAMAIDGKSTRGKSIGVSAEMVEKAIEQAHAERPAIALRFYTSDRLDVGHDWLAMSVDDVLEMLDYAAEGYRAREAAKLIVVEKNR